MKVQKSKFDKQYHEKMKSFSEIGIKDCRKSKFF